jgi:hypothetical protein
MTTVVSETPMKKTRKLVMQLAFGGLVGALAGYFGVGLIDRDTTTAEQVIVSGVGLIYLLIGLIVGFGLAAPKLGSTILNVEDADEINDQRRILTGSTICMIALGAALIGLAAAGPAGPVPPVAGFAGLLAAVAILIAITVRDWKYYDEMMRQLSLDAGNFAFAGVGGVVLIWASAAWLGLAAAPTPLALVGLVAGGLLLAVFVASARRGLLRPR